MPARRVIASPERTAADQALRGKDPTLGANRREGLLLVAYVILFLVGVWTVAVAELAPQEPSSPRASPAPNVTSPTQN